MSNWQPIFDDIQKELTLACEKFPWWPTDPIHAAAIIAEESGELIQATLELTYEPEKCTWEHMRSEAIQTAAMAIRFIAWMESYQCKSSSQVTEDGVTCWDKDKEARGRELRATQDT